MAVFKKYNGKRIDSSHPAYKKARWWCYKRIKGHKIIHCSIPEAQSRKEAESAERAMVEELFGRRYGATDNKTQFDSFVDKIYLKYAEQKDGNYNQAKTNAKQMKAFFGSRILSSITVADCRDFQWHRAKQTSNSSANRATAALSKVFSLAIEKGIVRDNPMRLVKKLPEPPPRRRSLTSEQRLKLQSVLADFPDLSDFVNLGLLLPLRRGQIFAIHADDINFESASLRIIASKGRQPRYIPLNAAAIEILRRRHRPNERIFENFPLMRFRRQWQAVKEKSGIPDFHFHDFRHIFGSSLINSGVNPYLVQELFGHSDMKVSGIYITVEDEMLHDAVNNASGLDILTSDAVN